MGSDTDIIRKDYTLQNDANRTQKRQTCLGDYAEKLLISYKNTKQISTIGRYRTLNPQLSAHNPFA